jgi:hypothetical protein
MTTPSDPMPEGGAEAAAPPAPPRKRRRWKLYLWIIALTPIVLFLLYTFVAYHWTYSSGDRSGILRKISQKGWLCKTWEGELAMTTVPGVMPESWPFTIRDDEVAANMNGAIGKQVVLHYREHRGLWSDCFGETAYFVESVRIVK